MKLILNPKAKEAHDKYIQELLIGAEEPNTLKTRVLGSDLWYSVSEYIPLLRTGEILANLIHAIESGTKVDLDMHDFDSAMVWEDTPQGHDYWSTINSITLENGL